jgi:hypothetical protein
METVNLAQMGDLTSPKWATPGTPTSPKRATRALSYLSFFS